LSLFQNPVGFGQALGKTDQKPDFCPKSFDLNLGQKFKLDNSASAHQILQMIKTSFQRFYRVIMYEQTASA
jgi:hypothetical protein